MALCLCVFVCVYKSMCVSVCDVRREYVCLCEFHFNSFSISISISIFRWENIKERKEERMNERMKEIHGKYGKNGKSFRKRAEKWFAKSLSNWPETLRRKSRKSWRKNLKQMKKIRKRVKISMMNYKIPSNYFEFFFSENH